MPKSAAENDRLKDERDSIVKSSRLYWFHWTAVILSLVLTVSAWQFSRQQVQEKAQVRFDREATHVVELIADRMRKYEEGLWGGVSAIHSHGGDMTRDEWRQFATASRIDLRYPGINGIGVIHRVNPKNRSAYVEVQRQSRPDFAVRPSHAGPDLLPITYIEPEKVNAQALGLDVAHEKNRYVAALKARDTGAAQITGPIVLVQDQGRTPGFLFYTPFYKSNSPETVAERRRDFTGLVYAPFVFKNLIKGTLEADRRQVRIKISDQADVLYDEEQAVDADRDDNPAFSQTRNIYMYGRDWRFDIWTTRSFRKDNSSTQPWLILAGGFLIDGLLLLLFVFLTRSNRRAIQFVDATTLQLQRRTAELQTSNEELESFAYAASHDLKAPLRGIANLATWIREDLDDEEAKDDVAKHVELLQGRVRRMETLLDDLLQFARAGRGTVASEEIDLATELQEMFELVAVSVDFTLDLQQPMPVIVTARTPDERQPSWPVPTTTLAGGAGRKTGMPVWRAAPPA